MQTPRELPNNFAMEKRIETATKLQFVASSGFCKIQIDAL
jgi:hypothetical protein